MWATLKQTNLLLGRYFTTDSLEKLMFSSLVQQKIVKNNKAQRKYTTISVHCPKKALRGTNVWLRETTLCKENSLGKAIVRDISK